MSQDMCSAKNDSAWTSTNSVGCCAPARLTVDGNLLCLHHARQAIDNIETQMRQDEIFKPWAEYVARKQARAVHG